MHRHKYDVISTNEHRSYEFLSEGPKGSIKKVINFEEMGDNFFNLSFGDRDEAEYTDKYGIPDFMKKK